MPVSITRYTKILFGMVFAVSVSLSAAAEENPDKFYRLEVGLQAGAAYYAGELAPHAFMSTAEAYGVQARVKIDPRWALQVKGQRQRVINTLKEDNEWNLRPGRYQVPMWHFDVTGEYNFFRLGLNEYDIHMRKITPFIFLGVGMTVHNVVLAAEEVVYPELWIKKGNRLDYAMYIPVGIGLKWKMSSRWQLQLAWQHNVYVLNGDGLEGAVDRHDPARFNNSYDMNGSNIMNNDITSTLTLGVIFEFAPKKDICPYCNL